MNDENTTSTDTSNPEPVPSATDAPAPTPQPSETQLSNETPPAETMPALPGPEEHTELPEHLEPASEPEAAPAESSDAASEAAPSTAALTVEEPQAPESDAPAERAPAETAEAEPEPPTVEEEPEADEPEPVAEVEPEPEPEPEPVAEAEEAPAEVAEEEVEEPVEAEPAAEEQPVVAEAAPESNKKWYVVKVTSGREESIKQAIERKVKIEGIEDSFGQIAIPVEEFVEKKKVSVKDKKTGQKVTQERNVVKKRKKFPGYIFAEVEFNDRILYLFRETSGVGDFVGATHHRAPSPMTDREVQSMLTGVAGPKEPGTGKRPVKVKLDFEKGDKVKVKDGAFAGSEAEVKEIIMPKDPTDTPKVKVVVTIWGRPVEMEMDYWHVDKA